MAEVGVTKSWVLYHQIRRMQSRQIECLRRGVHSDAGAAGSGGDACKWGEVDPLADDPICPDLVRDDEDVEARAEACEASELRTRPHLATRIMRVDEE